MPLTLTRPLGGGGGGGFLVGIKMMALLKITNPYWAFLALFFLLVITDKKNASVVHAVGGFFSEPQTPVLQAAETIIFGIQQQVAPSEDNNTNNTMGGTSILNVTMQIRILYEGLPSEFAWVLPLPSKPTMVGMGSEILFYALEKAAAPVFNLRILEESGSCKQTVLDEERNLCTSTPAHTDSTASATQIEEAANDSSMLEQKQPTVLEQGSLEPYDFVIIESSKENPDSAFDWLESNVSSSRRS
jgi:Uncharacterized protein conserved in bacteria (DUF2330)